MLREEKAKPLGTFSWTDFSIHSSKFDPSPLSSPTLSPSGAGPGSPALGLCGSTAVPPLLLLQPEQARQGPGHRLQHLSSPALRGGLQPSSRTEGRSWAALRFRHEEGVTRGLLKLSRQIIHTNLFKGANGFNY